MDENTSEIIYTFNAETLKMEIDRLKSLRERFFQQVLLHGLPSVLSLLDLRSLAKGYIQCSIL